MLTSELETEVRRLTDENNRDDLTPAKVLAALNQAQQRLARLSVQHFPELLKRNYVTTTDGGSREVVIPGISQAFTVTQANVFYGGVTYPVFYTNTTNVTQLQYEGSTTPVPVYYTMQGNKLQFWPKPSTGVRVQIFYQIRPPKLVYEQGRITDIDVDNGYLYLDAIGPDLTTSVSTLGAFINVIDQTTGDIKGTYQVAAIDTAQLRLTIKSSSLSRETVFGLTVSTELSEDITQDDYVCLASGTCIPLYFREYTDFLAQYAATQVKRIYGIPNEADAAALKDLEEDVKIMWASRPSGLRIQSRNRHWNRLNIAKPNV